MASMINEWQDGLELSPATRGTLARFAKRRRLLLVLRAFAAGLTVLLTSMLVIAAVDYGWIIGDGLRWTLGIVSYVATVAAMWGFGLGQLRSDDPRRIARQIESADPRLREDLLSAVELADPESANGSDAFRRRLQTSMGRRTSSINVAELLPIEIIRRWLMGGMAFVVVCVLLTLIPRAQFGRRFARAILPGFAIQRASMTDLTIIDPSPPSGFVAQGDAVGVTVDVSGVAVDEVTLHWTTADGTVGQTPMTRRVSVVDPSDVVTIDDSDPDPGANRDPQSASNRHRYAANLLVGSDQIQYRIIAGDAVTLWHRLTPLPRPHAVAFSKRYRFPSYAKLDDRIEQADHGDLEALVGTRAEITVEFDEPVDDANVRFGVRGPVYPMDSIDGSAKDFRTTIPITTPSEYQIDATSSRSGLNNPFSDQYRVTPVIDQQPVVRWADDQATTILVSPLEQVDLSALASDDLPLDRMIQEFQINGDPLVQRLVRIDVASRQLEMNWTWDLLHRINQDAESAKLSGGDIVRVRLVASDRLGQRGESPFIELLVADDQFDADRHSHLDSVGRVTTLVREWTSRAESILSAAIDPIQQGDPEAIGVQGIAAEELRKSTEALIDRMLRQVAASNDLAEGRAIELMGLGVIDLDLQLGRLFELTPWIVNERHESWGNNRQRELQRQAGLARSLSHQASRLNTLAQIEFAQQFTVAIATDVLAVDRSLEPLIESTANDRSVIPIERVPQYLTMVTGRLDAIDQFLTKHAANLPESTRRHYEQWSRWSQQWAGKLADVDPLDRTEEQIRNLIQQFASEIQNQYDHSMVDGRLSAVMQQVTRDVPREIGLIGNLIDSMGRDGRESKQAAIRAADENDSNKAAESVREAKLKQLAFQLERDCFLARIHSEETLHRQLPSVDLRYAADLNLIARAVKNVTEDGFSDYQGQAAAEVFDSLAEAFRLIESAHNAEMGLREIRALWDAERRLDETTVAKFGHPDWLERYPSVMEWPVRDLQKAGIDWKQLQPISDSRGSEDFGQAKNRITRRRWSPEPMLSASASLGRIHSDVALVLKSIEPETAEARNVILRYVLTLPEQAAKAAKEVRDSKQATADRADESDATLEQVQAVQADAQRDVQETMEALMDFANTANMGDDSQRELARDADAAAAKIQDRMKSAQQKIMDAANATDDFVRQELLNENIDALDELAKSLEDTADHFERAANGEDVSESRQDLRQAEADLKIAEQMQRRFDQAKTMAQAAQSSPQEMMQRLEQELKRNPPMQQELSEIASDAVEEAVRSLQASAREEVEIDRSLQRSDSSFQEAKYRAARMMVNAARRAATVDQSMLDTLDGSVQSAKLDDLRQQVEAARDPMRRLIQQINEMGGDQAPLVKITDTAAAMADAVLQATKRLDEIKDAAADATTTNIHADDEKQRENETKKLERDQRNIRTARSNAASRERLDWTSSAKDAGRRVMDFQRKKRDSKQSIQQLESRLAKSDKDQDNLRRQIAQSQQRQSQAERAETAARETQKFATEQSLRAKEREKDLQAMRLEQLDQPNPAAQLAVRLVEQTKDELESIRQDMLKVAGESDRLDQLRAPKDQARDLMNRQRQTTDDVAAAVDDLLRAARHESRLDRPLPAADLDQAAENVREGAQRAAESATDQLQQAMEEASESARASEMVAAAEASIREAADALTDLTDGSDGKPNESADAAANEDRSSNQTANDSQARELAQTLDELDQALADSQEPSSPESGDPSDSESSSDSGEAPSESSDAQNADSGASEGQDGQPGQAQQGQGQSEQGQSQQQSGPTTSAEASPTLASLIEAASQAAARQRQQQISPTPGEGGPPGGAAPTAPSESSAAGDPSSLPGSGLMPDGGAIDATGFDREGLEWGALRQRRTEDAVDSASVNVPIQYRREIEAYFQAIAKQAAQQQ
ncbi:hypothetical protein K227x_30680 [Rubripirellula lacrimiformis]|uniref:Uncharacterized protein n=1 Tax=Rubripirellula lacrimiformis TaxID=1930273 RepID=A0A517NC09_9BACT|nr:hypothetical protein [Rubripirellula lacrimiformis]QDT04674.1 hypothetical protein K227x_30680 [Rubripirellula lacrimiformis]